MAYKNQANSKKTKKPTVPKKKKFSVNEKRAYWAGIGFQANDNGMRSQQLQFLMTDKCKESFVNGRVKADNLSSKFIPDLFAPKSKKK